MVGIRDFFSPPFSPSEAEASLMAVEEKKAAPTAPRGHIISSVSSHYPPVPVSLRFCPSWSTSIFSYSGEELDIGGGPRWV